MPEVEAFPIDEIGWINSQAAKMNPAKTDPFRLFFIPSGNMSPRLLMFQDLFIGLPESDWHHQSRVP